MTMQAIRDKYKVPAQRGALVRNRYNKCECKITQSTRTGLHLHVRYHNGAKATFHPFELDYYVDGKWLSGKRMGDWYDYRLNQWWGVKPINAHKRPVLVYVQWEKPDPGLETHYFGEENGTTLCGKRFSAFPDGAWKVPGLNVDEPEPDCEQCRKLAASHN